MSVPDDAVVVHSPVIKKYSFRPGNLTGCCVLKLSGFFGYFNTPGASRLRCETLVVPYAAPFWYNTLPIIEFSRSKSIGLGPKSITSALQRRQSILTLSLLAAAADAANSSQLFGGTGQPLHWMGVIITKTVPKAQYLSLGQGKSPVRSVHTSGSSLGPTVSRG